jgi:Ribbon-helix-helix domain
MLEQHRRVGWVTRIYVKPAEREELREISKQIKVSMSKLIGIAISDFLTERSSA